MKELIEKLKNLVVEMEKGGPGSGPREGQRNRAGTGLRSQSMKDAIKLVRETKNKKTKGDFKDAETLKYIIDNIDSKMIDIENKYSNKGTDYRKNSVYKILNDEYKRLDRIYNKK